MILSHSGYQVFKQCPLRFRMEYIDRLDKYRVEYQATKDGTEFHLLMKDIFETLKTAPLSYSYIAHKVLTNYQLPQRLIDAIDDPIIANTIIQAFKYNGKAEEEIALKMEDGKLVRTFFDDLNAMFRGIIDLWWVEDDTAYIVDWKTGRRLEVHNEQLEFYVMLIASAYPQLKDKHFIVSFVHITDHVEKNEFEIDKSVDEIINEWVNIYEYINSLDKFPQRAGVWCMFCPVAHHCPIEDQITTRDPQKLLEIYYKSKAMHENAKGLLMELIEEIGELEYNDEVIELRNVRKPYVNQEKFRKLLKQSDIQLDDIIDFITISPSGAKALGIDKEIVDYRSYKQLWNKKKRG